MSEKVIDLNEEQLLRLVELAVDTVRNGIQSILNPPGEIDIREQLGTCLGMYTAIMSLTDTCIPSRDGGLAVLLTLNLLIQQQIEERKERFRQEPGGAKIISSAYAGAQYLRDRLHPSEEAMKIITQ